MVHRVFQCVADANVPVSEWALRAHCEGWPLPVYRLSPVCAATVVVVCQQCPAACCQSVLVDWALVQYRNSETAAIQLGSAAPPTKHTTIVK